MPGSENAMRLAQRRIYRGCINKTQRLQTITPLVLISSLASCGGT
jgi:hypothetical protein